MHALRKVNSRNGGAPHQSSNIVADFGSSSRHLFSTSSPLIRSNQPLLLSTVPVHETRIKSGIVERRTIHANVIWREREMILTENSILFSRPDSKIVVDQISIQDIVSVGKVDSLDTKSVATKPTIMKESTLKSQKMQQLARQGLSSIYSSESRDSVECSRQKHAFEIKTCSDCQYRSYFVRVDSISDCDDWVEKIKLSITSAKSEHALEISRLQAWQQNARDFYDDRRVRYLIATAIILDFFSSVFESEFIDVSNDTFLSLFAAIDVLLCVFFSLELAINLFGQWRTAYGTPFVLRFSSWFLLATVLFQLSGFFLPKLDANHLKVGFKSPHFFEKNVCSAFFGVAILYQTMGDYD